jgi:hypothetical protein
MNVKQKTGKLGYIPSWPSLEQLCIPVFIYSISATERQQGAVQSEPKDGYQPFT